MPELDLFASARASVTAPAGCGKTQLIADSLMGYGSSKPILVLTHTNAGKGALEARLERARVSRATYRLATIDSWSLKMIGRFPQRSGCNPAMLRVDNPAVDYPAIRAAALRLLGSGDIDDLLHATYARLIVDEYQDCTIPQHAIIEAMAWSLPTCVLGDPLQAIFDFREATVDWTGHVHTTFPQLGAMNTPWRWRRVGAERLGEWLLAIRAPLLASQAIDLGSAPAEVQHVQTSPDPDTAHLQRMEAARTKPPKDGTVLVIGDSKSRKGQQNIARATPGASTVEAVDLPDLAAFARGFDPAGKGAVQSLLEFAGEMMTNLGGAELHRRLESLQKGTARKGPSPMESACLTYIAHPSYAAAAELLDQLEECQDVRVFRYELLHVFKSALRSAGSGNGGGPFSEAATVARERNRHLGRRIGKIGVGSTLLLKGLEADVSVVLNPAVMNARHLYVALTRGARKLVVCAPHAILTPAAR